MPKQRITKEAILETAFKIAREQGLEKVLVKNIATALNCSVQPIYSYYKNMDDLKKELVNTTHEYIKRYISEHLDEKNHYLSVGAAYINFAKEEPNLFKLYFLHERMSYSSFDELYREEVNPSVTRNLSESLSISIDNAKMLHLNMIIYEQGLSSILSNKCNKIPAEETIELLNHAYEAFLGQALKINK